MNKSVMALMLGVTLSACVTDYSGPSHEVIGSITNDTDSPICLRHYDLGPLLPTGVEIPFDLKPDLPALSSPTQDGLQTYLVLYPGQHQAVSYNVFASHQISQDEIERFDQTLYLPYIECAAILQDKDALPSYFAASEFDTASDAAEIYPLWAEDGGVLSLRLIWIIAEANQ